MAEYGEQASPQVGQLGQPGEQGVVGLVGFSEGLLVVALLVQERRAVDQGVVLSLGILHPLIVWPGGCSTWESYSASARDCR